MQAQQWHLARIHFYTGVPDYADKPFWNAFWVNKLAAMGRAGVVVYSRRLVYRNKTIMLPGGNQHSFLDGEEKGIDVRLALDALHMAYAGEYDVAIVFSQDQDLSELATLIRTVGKAQNRWIKIASAYPDSPAATNHRGINFSDWIRIDRVTYDASIDPRDYRPKP